MKKLLSLLSAVLVVGSSASTVVACKGSSSNNNEKKTKAEDIAKKITETGIALPAKTDPDTSNTATIDALKLSLRRANPSLSADNVKHITFSKVNLQDNEQSNVVEATISINDTTAKVQLNVEIHSTASQIAAKITNPKTTILALRADSDPNLNDPNALKALKSLIQTTYKSLSNYDMTTISVVDANGIVLQDNEKDNIIKLSIIDDATLPTTQTLTLDKVQIHSTAAQIKNKIVETGHNIISILNTNASDDKLSQTNINKIIASIDANNALLSTYDKAQLSINVDLTKTLILDTQSVINLNIKDDAIKTNPVVQAQLSVYRSISDTSNTYIFRNMVSKIATNVPLEIPAGSNNDILNATTKDAIKTSLKKENPSLTEAEMNLIFAIGPRKTTTRYLLNNELPNYISIGIRKVKAKTLGYIDMIVEIHSTAQEIKAKLNNFKKLRVSFVSNQSNLDSYNALNFLRIFSVINTELSTWDQEQLSLDPAAMGKNLPVQTQVPIIIKITDDQSVKGAAQITVQAYRFASNNDEYKVNHIADKISNGIVLGIPAGSSTVFNNSKEVIKQKLKQLNISLTADDLNKIVLTHTGPLRSEEQDNSVNAVITAGTASTTVTLNKVRINRTASEIQNLFTNPSGTIIALQAGTSGSPSSASVENVILNAIQKKYNLTNHDKEVLGILNQSQNLNDAERDNSVVITIRDDQSTPQVLTTTFAKVQIHRTRAQIKTLIGNSRSITITGAGGDTGTGTIDQRIIDALKAAITSPQISDWDLSQITIKSGVAITTGGVTVQLSIVDDDSSVTVPVTENITVSSSS